jgi:hypothetical protein
VDQIKKNLEEGHVANMGNRKDTYKVSAGKPYVEEATWKTKL